MLEAPCPSFAAIGIVLAMSLTANATVAAAPAAPAASDTVHCDGFENTSCGAPTTNQFSFLAYGDSRSGNGCDGNAVHIGLVSRMVAEQAPFVFHLGDMITGYDASTNWVSRGTCPLDASRGSFKEIIAPLQNKPAPPGLPVSFFPVVGNHDDNWNDQWYPDPSGQGFCSVFDPTALVPNHTQQPYYSTLHSAQYTNTQFNTLACSLSSSEVYPTFMYYSFNYHNTHFAVMRLNSDYDDLQVCNNCSGNEQDYDDYYRIHQLHWLRADLAAAASQPGIDNLIVLLHAPLFTTSDGHQGNVSWPALSKLFSQYRVKLVISGHNHVYERTWPIFASATFPNGVRDDANGTVYTITGGGGSALHGFNSESPLMAYRNSTFQYLRIDINGAQVTLKSIGADGTLLDTYSR